MQIRKSVKFSAYFIVFLTANSPSFSAELPTNTDLKAVYCLTISNDSFKSIALAESMMPMFPLDKQEEIKRDLATRRENLKRLQSYLFPRFKYLDFDSLMVAEKRAQQDMEVAKNEMLACVTACTDKRCSDQCFDSPSAATVRVRSCNDISWLPF